MSCRRAFDVDLVACLLDRGRPEWATFRDHYPTCPDCAAEVRAWTELQAELAPAHPEPRRLLRFEDEPSSLPADERHAIREHVAACAACRDELQTLRTTDLPALVRAGTAAATPDRALAAPPPRRRRRGHRRFGARLRGFVWHPGFAYALVLALLIPALAPYRDTLVPTSSGPEPAPEEAAAPLGALLADDGARAKTAPSAVPARADADRRQEAERDLHEYRASAEREEKARVASADRLAAMEHAAGDAGVAPAATLPMWPRLDMTPGSKHLVIAASPGLLLTLPVPGDATTAGPATLRIRETTGGRELREEYVGPPTRRIVMRVPGDWLVPGAYVVELMLDDDTPAAAATLDVAARSPR